MALSSTTLARLEEAKTAVEEWRDQRIQEIEETAAFLRSVNVAVSSLSEASQETATDNAEALIDSILTL